MNPNGLTREELGHYAPIDAEVAAFVVKNAPTLFEEAEDFYDPAGCYDDGHSEGSNAQLKDFRDKFLERVQEARGELVGSEVVNMKLSELLKDLEEALE